MQKLKNMRDTVTLFIDNMFTILVVIAEVVASVYLFRADEVQTMIGNLPMLQVLAALLIADAVMFVYRLRRDQQKIKQA